MRRTLKRNSLVSTLSFSLGTGNSVRVQGDVYPFAQRFHSVRFMAERGPRFGENPDEVRYEGGFGGNTFEAEQFDLVLKAGQFASDLAKYYAARMKEFLNPTNSYQALHAAFAEEDFEAAFEVVVMQPLSNDSRFKVNHSMCSKHAPKAMTVLDMLPTFPAFDRIMERLEQAMLGDVTAWDSPEIDILRVLFNGSDSWNQLRDRIPDEAEFHDRARVMQAAIIESKPDFLEQGIFTAFKNRYGSK